MFAVPVVKTPSACDPIAVFSAVSASRSGTNTTTFSATGAHLWGIATDDDSVDQINGDTSVIFGTTAVPGDRIVIKGVDATHWSVHAISSVAGAITLA